MTEKQLRKLVRRWAKRLGIGHYELVVDVVPFEGDALAEVKCSQYERAHIKVQPFVLRGERMHDVPYVNGLEQTIVHELLHIVLYPLQSPLQILEETSTLPGALHDFLDEARSRREEEVVDRLAVALVKAWGGKP